MGHRNKIVRTREEERISAMVRTGKITDAITAIESALYAELDPKKVGQWGQWKRNLLRKMATS